MISILLGNALPLRLQIEDGLADKFIKAYVFNGASTLVTSIDLSHLTSGLYVGYWTPVTAGTYHAVYILYTDNTYTTTLGPYYRQSSDTFVVQSMGDIGESVWNTDLVDNNASNSAARILKDLLVTTGGIDATTLADLVWSKTTTDFSDPNTFGLLVNLLNQRTINMENELNSNIYGLSALRDHTSTKAVEVIAEINANEAKIDQIIPAINAARDLLSNEHSAMVAMLQAMAIANNQNKVDIIAQIDQNEIKLDEIKTNILSLSNNTTVRFVVPDQMIRPETGTTTYRFHLRLFDELGNPEAPDSTPTIIIQDIITSGTQSGSMTQDGVKVGAYYYDYTIAPGSALNPLFIEAAVVENGVTRYIPATSQITEFSADLNSIQTELAQVHAKVADSQSKINNNIFGLSALQQEIVDLSSDLTALAGDVTDVKTTTDNLPLNIATSVDVASVLSAVSVLPTLTQISNLLTITRDAIMGVGGKTNTDVYNRFDISTLLQSNDPRLDNLDATISSRANLTVADIWNHATRTLTAITIPSVEAKKIWDVLLTDVSSSGSFGTLIKNILDVAISSRATSAQVQSLLGGVAQETTLGSALSAIVGEVNQNEVKLNTIVTLLNSISPDVTLIKNTKALESSVNNQATVINNTLSNLNLLINAIKLKTDNIPGDPARESTVSMRPTNPVLNSDSRLVNLDAKISTRSMLNASSLAPLARTTDVVAETATILSALNAVMTAINSILTNIDPIPTNTEMDAKLSNLSTLVALEAAKDQLMTAIGNISSSGGGLSAADVWSHPSRALTGEVTLNSTQFTDIAKKSDIKDFSFNVSTSLVSGSQTVFIGIHKNGKMVSVNNISVSVKKDDGVSLWSSLSDANIDGVHVLTSPVALQDNKVYYIKIIAEINSEVVTYNSPFTTVG
jgi:hypothetical protein